MKLPNALLAVVEREKVVDYLLNRAHRYGRTVWQLDTGQLAPRLITAYPAES